jgi:hypothetical protein
VVESSPVSFITSDSTSTNQRRGHDSTARISQDGIGNDVVLSSHVPQILSEKNHSARKNFAFLKKTL